MVKLRTGSLVALAGAVLLSLAAAATAQETGFVRGKGRTDVALSYSLDTYDKFWMGDEEVDNDDMGFGQIDRHAINLYAAHGLTDDIDITANLSLVRVETEEVFSDRTGLQDGIVQLKWRFLSQEVGPGRLNLLASPAVKFNTWGYENNAVNALGDGNIDLRVRGIVQYVFNFGLFAALESGYDVRFDEVPNEFPLSVAVGGTVFNRVFVYGYYSLVNSFGDDDIGEVPFPEVEEDYDRIGLQAFLSLTEHFGISGGYFQTIDGKNTGDVTGYNAGVVFQF